MVLFWTDKRKLVLSFDYKSKVGIVHRRSQSSSFQSKGNMASPLFRRWFTLSSFWEPYKSYILPVE
jgi:hypothetical protein